MCSSGDNFLATELATEATSLWSLGQHDAALQTLQRLEGLLPNDPEVHVNQWLANYYADSSTSLDALNEQLATWLDTQAPGDAATRTAYTTAALNYGILLYMQQRHSTALAVLQPLYFNAESMHGGAALCLCVLLLEIFLGSSQFTKAVEVLHYLQSATAPGMPARAAFSDDIDDDASSSQARDAEQLLGQQALGGLRHELLQSPKQTPNKSPQCAASPSRLQQQQQQLSAKQSPKVPVEQQQDKPQPQQEQQQKQPTGPLTLDLPLVTRCTSAFMQQVLQVVEQQGGQVPSLDNPALLHLYKARLAMACSNHKAAKKEVKALLALQPSSSTAILLKSQLEVMRQQPKKALKTLAPVLSAVGDCSTRCKLQLLNVLAAIHQQLGKHHVAALYLSAALAQHQQAQAKQQGQQCLQESSQPQQEGGKQQRQGTSKQQQQASRNAAKASVGAAADASQQGAAATEAAAHQGPRDSWQLLLDSSDALQYNMGLQQLALCNWQAAIDCFNVASCKYYTQPQLWLRMAEASISLYHEQQEAKQLLQEQQQRQQRHHHHQQQQQQLPVLIHIGQQVSRIDSSSSTVESVEAAGRTLLQQAAEQLSTGLALLRRQQAEAARQAEEAAAALTAAAVAAAAAGDQQSTLPGAATAGVHGCITRGAPPASLFSQGHYMADTFGSRAIASVDPADVPGCSSSSSNSAAAASGNAAEDAAAAAAAVGITPLGAGMLAPATPAIQQALLANQAYVYLLQQQPQQALEAAKALLACSSMNPQQHYLGSCYASEALCILGRVEDAAEQLQDHMALYNSQVSSSAAGSGTATPSSLAASAKAAEASEFGISSNSVAQHAADWVGAASTTATTAAGAGGGGLFHAGSIMSDDDSSCVGCKGGGVCGAGLARPGAASSTPCDGQVAVLCNMSSVLAVQGDVQESRRYAAMAVAQDPSCAAANAVLCWCGFLETGQQQQLP